jgi:hypothetical protein
MEKDWTMGEERFLTWVHGRRQKNRIVYRKPPWGRSGAETIFLLEQEAVETPAEPLFSRNKFSNYVATVVPMAWPGRKA